ncbi:hypothetical protein GH714_026440 [Hevea brasiliensis]|uniref:Response regulatory domain-containing protein n=1 Tax=Hevea brasiliensis TaxID=3981 RepID=A0A6A6KWV6_HEVBR|nr:hypothetical protein GH714_026440 [Hevea brasiliensis]
MSNYVEGPASLTDALSEGLSPSSDWNARVAAFNHLRSLLQQGPKGIQEVIQNFEKVMKLFFQHLDDPHHKVAQAALSTLADIIPSCRKPFESYMERILPHVFSRLIDPKELVRQPCSTTLEIVSKTYSVDTLLPALLRSLDEQRSPKAKLAVIEFAISSLNKHAMNSEGSGNIGILKLWLAKLTPLARDKNTKLKEAAITCIISVYSHYDPTAVLNFILSLSVEEQNSLRRALKQYTPRIEVDLMNFLQNKKERQRSKSSYDPSDVVGTSSEEGYIGVSKSQFFGRYSAGSIDGDGGRKWSSTQESTLITSIGQAASDENQENLYHDFENGSNVDIHSSKTRDFSYMVNSTIQNVGPQAGCLENVDNSLNLEGIQHENDASLDLDLNHHKPEAVKINSFSDSGPSIPQILHLICNDNDESPASRRGALQQLTEASIANDHFVWSKYFNQILTAVLEVLDDRESLIQELALSLIVEMLKNQKDAMEDSVEIVIEKLLHVTKDAVPKVSNEAEHCLSILLSQYDPFKCLSVVVPLLVTEDEKTLVTCINCLTKLVGRLSQEELMTQLPSFLPALFEAFGNQSADVRKTVVFCLVDIYIMLGKAFLPYLEGLNSTQLRLVTIYANRISQARTDKSDHAAWNGVRAREVRYLFSTGLNIMRKSLGQAMEPPIASSNSSGRGGNSSSGRGQMHFGGPSQNPSNGLYSVVNRNRPTALHLDGDSIYRMVQKGILQHYGVDTQDVDNGTAAINVLMGLTWMDLRQMRAMGIRSKIVGTTSCWCERDRQAFLNAGADEFFEKPLSSETLLTILTELDGGYEA